MTMTLGNETFGMLLLRAGPARRGHIILPAWFFLSNQCIYERL